MYLGLRSGCLDTRHIANAPDCDSNATGATVVVGIGSLYSGMNKVLYLPGTDRMPRQLPPFRSGPLVAPARESSRADRILETMASVPDFSSRPPGMTMTDSALSSSASSAMQAGAWAAGITSTNRSTFSGSEATSGTQRQPSSSGRPGLTT